MASAPSPTPPPLPRYSPHRCVVAMRGLIGATMFLARLDAQQHEVVRGNSNVVLAEREVAGVY